MFCGQYRNIDVEYCIIMVSQHGIDFFNLFGKGNLKCEFLQLFMKTFMLKIIPFETHINNNSMKKKIYFFFLTVDSGAPEAEFSSYDSTLYQNSVQMDIKIIHKSFICDSVPSKETQKH